jgi:hypothetical protein
MSLQLATASYIYIHYALNKKRKERRWWQRQLYTSREVYSGSRFLTDLNFKSVSGLYKNFNRMSPSEFEFLINLMGKNLEKGQRSGKPFLFKKGWHFALIDGSVHFFPQFLPCILLSNFVKMNCVFWVPNYLFSFIKFGKFYDTFLSPLHCTITKTLKNLIGCNVCCKYSIINKTDIINVLMINISVLYFACYRCSLNTNKPDTLPSTFKT